MSDTRVAATAANDGQRALLLACFDGRKTAAKVDAKSPLTKSALDAYSRRGSQRLVLNFNSTKGGAVLGASDAA